MSRKYLSLKDTREVNITGCCFLNQTGEAKHKCAMLALGGHSSALVCGVFVVVVV